MFLPTYLQLPSVQTPLAENSEYKYAATGQTYVKSTSNGLILAGLFEEPNHTQSKHFPREESVLPCSQECDEATVGNTSSSSGHRNGT